MARLLARQTHQIGEKTMNPPQIFQTFEVVEELLPLLRPDEGSGGAEILWQTQDEIVAQFNAFIESSARTERPSAMARGLQLTYKLLGTYIARARSHQRADMEALGLTVMHHMTNVLTAQIQDSWATRRAYH